MLGCQYRGIIQESIKHAFNKFSTELSIEVSVISGGELNEISTPRKDVKNALTMTKNLKAGNLLCREVRITVNPQLA